NTLRELTTLVVEELDRHAKALTRIEEELAFHTNTALLALIDRQLPLVVWTTDTDLRLTSISGNGVRDLPGDLTPFLGQPVNAYWAATASVRPTTTPPGNAELDRHYQALAGQVVVFQCELGGQAYSGQIEPLRDGAGQIIGCL